MPLNRALTPPSARVCKRGTGSVEKVADLLVESAALAQSAACINVHLQSIMGAGRNWI